MNCINCGKASQNKPFAPIPFVPSWTVIVCNDCIKEGNKIDIMLNKGISLGYADGTKEVLYQDGIKEK